MLSILSINIVKIEIKGIVLSKKDSYGKRGFMYFIGYISNDGIIPLCIKFPQMNAFAKYFDNNNKYMNFLVRNGEKLKKYNAV